MGESVSLKDIAKACNVSVSTVSKAMNDRADVSSAKKVEIRKITKGNELCSKLYGVCIEEPVYQEYRRDPF